MGADPQAQKRDRAVIRRRVAYVFSAVLVSLGLIQQPPIAQAATTPVAAGDTIVHGDLECTLGYVYRASGHTMAVSAGHCAGADHTGPVTDREAGITGRTISVTYIPSHDDGPPLKDWWLIDFGDVAWSDHIAHTHYQVITYMNVREADWVCHYGEASAQEICGYVSKVNTPLITVTQVGRKGDSGGPTYMKINDTVVAAVGLWQGHFTSPYPGGYVMSLPAALDYFRTNSTQLSAAMGSVPKADRTAQ